jgi:hypothetical protein
MFLRYILKNSIQPKILYRPYIRNFSTSEGPKQETPKKPKKELEIVITPKKIFIGLVVLSWVGLLKLWYDAEEIVRNRAQEYYDQGGRMDEKLPEEYRKEYVTQYLIIL